MGASTADDVVGETFLAAMRDRGRYRPERATVRAWLDIPPGTVRSRLHRVRRRLRGHAPSIDPTTIKDGEDD